MSVRPIRLFGDPILTSPARPIDHIDDGIRALVEDLVDTVREPGRAGVAAPQIGVGLRAFSYNVDDRVGYVLNPRLTALEGTPELVGEGCLSVPGLWHPVLRYPRATVTGIDIDGAELIVTGEGVLAQALQHETDHLDGKLYLHRLERDQRRIAMREVRESDWF